MPRKENQLATREAVKRILEEELDAHGLLGKTQTQRGGGGGNREKVKERGLLVKQVMQEHGLSLGEASKWIKAHHTALQDAFAANACRCGSRGACIVRTRCQQSERCIVVRIFGCLLERTTHTWILDPEKYWKQDWPGSKI